MPFCSNRDRPAFPVIEWQFSPKKFSVRVLRSPTNLSVAQCRAPGFDQEMRAQYPSLTMHHLYLGKRAMDSLQRWKHQAMSLVFLPKLLLQRVARQVARRHANAHSRSGDAASMRQDAAGHARTSNPFLTKVPSRGASHEKLSLNVCVTTASKNLDTIYNIFGGL